MAVPGTGSTNQSLTFAAAKKVGGKAHTSNLKEIYNETIPSNIQISTEFIFGEDIPQTVTTDTLYQRFSASAGADPTVEYVEFYVQSIAGTTYDANTGSFGDVGFGGGDESQSAGPHGYQLVLTSSYEASSSNPSKGSGFLVDDQVINQSNGGLQLVHPLFGPQTGNNYTLQLYTAHPLSGGLQIPTTSPIEWLVDYYNGTIFVQDYISTAVPTYARGFIYIGKTAKTLITEASSSGGGGATNPAGSNTQVQFNNSGNFGASANLTFDGSNLKIVGATSGSSTLQAAGATTLGSTLDVSGNVTLAGLSSGSLAGSGSYLGLNTNNEIILTSSSGTGVGNLSITGDTGSDTVTVGTDTLNFSGSTGIDTTVSTDKVAIELNFDNLEELTGGLVAAADTMVIADANDSNNIKKTTLTELARLHAGSVVSTGIVNENATLKINISGLQGNTAASDTDTIIVDDNGADTITRMTRSSFLGGGFAKFNSGMSATVMSASSTLQVVGGTTLGENLAVSGTVSLAGVSSGSIAGTGSYLGLNENNQLVLTSSQGGLAGNPAGSNTQVQFNDNGSFGASSNLTFDGTTLTLVGGLSGSSTLQAVGATTLGSTLSVSGTTNLSVLTASSVAISGISEGAVIVASAGGVLSEFPVLRYGGTGLFLGNNASLSGSVNFFGGYTDSPDVGASYDSSTGQFSLRGNLFTAASVLASGIISGSSELQSVGAATLGSTLAVSGSVTLAGASSGSIAGPGSYLGLNSNNQIVLTSSSGGGGAGNPAGSNTEIQFNDGGSFGASSNLIFNGSSLQVIGDISGSTTFQAVGNAFLGSDLAVSGSIGVGVSGAGITHAITLPDNSDTTGKIKANAYLTYSSIRYKKDVEPLEDPLGTLNKLDGVSYVWKDTGRKDYGFIAEEVGKVLPDIVEFSQDSEYANSMDYIRIISFLVEGVKVQDKKITNLEKKLDLLIEKLDK